MGKKKLVFVILVFIVIIVIFLTIKLSKENYSTDKKIKKEFYDNYDIISCITETLEEIPYSNINIQNVDYIYNDGNFGTWYVCDDEIGIEGIKKIPNVKLIEMLNKIFTERKYQLVSKNDKTISFQLWSNLDDGRGIAYTPDGNPPTLQFLTKFEKLKKENWYYYEENFNEWRLNNK